MNTIFLKKTLIISVILFFAAPLLRADPNAIQAKVLELNAKNEKQYTGQSLNLLMAVLKAARVSTVHINNLMKDRDLPLLLPKINLQAPSASKDSTVKENSSTLTQELKKK